MKGPRPEECESWPPPIGAVRAVARFVRRPQYRHNVLHEWRRARAGMPALTLPDNPRVLVICYGNICRSPYAAAVLAARAPEWTVRSAGLNAGRANPPEPGALRCALRTGVDLSNHESTPMDDDNVAWADLVLAMEGHHLTQIARRFPNATERSRSLGDFAPGPPYTIADPWGEPDPIFGIVFSQIGRSIDLLLELCQGATQAGQGRPPAGSTT